MPVPALNNKITTIAATHAVPSCLLAFNMLSRHAMLELLLEKDEALSKWREQLCYELKSLSGDEKKDEKKLKSLLDNENSLDLYKRIASELIEKLAEHQNVLPIGVTGMKLALTVVKKDKEAAQEAHTDRQSTPAYWTVALGPTVTTCFGKDKSSVSDHVEDNHATAAPAWNGTHWHAGIASTTPHIRIFLVLMRESSNDPNTGLFSPISKWTLTPQNNMLVDLTPKSTKLRATRTPTFPPIEIPAAITAATRSRRDSAEPEPPQSQYRNPYCISPYCIRQHFIDQHCSNPYRIAARLPAPGPPAACI